MALSNRNVMSIYMILLCIIVNIYVSNGLKDCDAMINESNFLTSCQDINSVKNKVAANERNTTLIQSFNNVIQRYVKYISQRDNRNDVMFYTTWCLTVKNLCMESLRRLGFIHRNYLDSNTRKVFRNNYQPQKNGTNSNLLSKVIGSLSNMGKSDYDRSYDSAIDDMNFEQFLSVAVVNTNIQRAKDLKDNEFISNLERRFGNGYKRILLGAQTYDKALESETFCINDCVAYLREAKYNTSSLWQTDTFFLADVKKFSGCVVLFTNEKKRRGKNSMMQATTLEDWCLYYGI